MLHYMRLDVSPFEKIMSGKKTIELRLNDEKRRTIRKGDFIEFISLSDENRKIQTVVTELYCFDSFRELYEKLPLTECGYTEETAAAAHYSDMEKYYSQEEQSQNGVVGIGIRLTALQRFIDAQENGYDLASDYNTALEEIRNGFKYSHWMWYVFPQLSGLSRGDIGTYFSVRDAQEAKDYYNHPVLGKRLVEVSEALLELETDDLVAVFGEVDAYKLRSCMTLFASAAPEQEVFRKVIGKYCLGILDEKTLAML